MSAGWPPAPEEFSVRGTPTGVLYARRDLEHEIAAAGLDASAAWERLLDRGLPATGRGSSAVLAQPPGRAWRVKRMRRGGLLAPLWRDRYASPDRLVALLAASGEVARRGIPTPPAVALLIERAGPGLVRAYLATEEIEGAEDLARLADRGAVARESLGAALALVRSMHDRGIDHPDLNMGNLLLAASPDGPRALVVDLDRVAFRDGPVPDRLRRRDLLRLERSCAKRTGSPRPLGPGSEGAWSALYAGDDASLARRVELGRTVDRLSLALHRLGWRSTSR